MVHGGDRLAVRRGRLEAGIDVAGLGHAQRDPSTDLRGHGLRGEGAPFVSASFGRLVAEARTGASVYEGRIGEERWSRTLHLSDLSLAFPLVLVGGRVLHLGGVVRHFRPGGTENDYTWAGGSATAVLGRGSLGASVGRWVEGLGDEAATLGVGGSASLTISSRSTLWLRAQREAFDPIFLETDRTSWGIGISYRPGAPSPRPAAGAEIRRGQRVTIRVPLSETGSPPEIAGDFSEWEPVPMHRRGSDWEVTFELEPGLYQYAFRNRDGTWFVPEGVPGRRDDGMGGWVATLLVPSSGS